MKKPSNVPKEIYKQKRHTGLKTMTTKKKEMTIADIGQALLDINDRITELKCEFSEFMDIIIPLLEPKEDEEIPKATTEKLKEIIKKTKNTDCGGMFG